MKAKRFIPVALLVLGLGFSAVWFSRKSERANLSLPHRDHARAQASASARPASARVVSPPAPSRTSLAVPAITTQAAPLSDFQGWLNRYLSASRVVRAQMENEGVQLAQARRPAFKALIATSPEEALRQAVPMTARQALPPSITRLLEERVNGRGVLRTYLSYPSPESDQPPILRYAEFESGRTYQAFVYGRRAETVRWVPNASLNGVAVDEQFAVNSSPLRVLEAGEIPPLDKSAVTVCPVSGKSTATVPTGEPVTQDTPAVEAYGEIIYLCDGSHVTLYEELLVSGEGVTGGPQRFTGILPAAPSPSLGQLRVLYIPMTFADQNQIPATEARCYEVMREVSDFFANASFGRLSCMPTVTPPIKLPHNEAWYKQKDNSDGFSKEIDGLGLEHQHAREEARKLGYDSTDFDAVVVRLVGGPRTAGGWGGGSSVWVYSDSPSIVAHELGHCFGLSHANFWDTGGASAIGPGGNNEYGDPYDVMGGGPFPRNHYNVQAKNQIRWLPDEFVQNVNESGVYRISAFDQKYLEPSRRYALKLPKDGQRTYWGEVRALFDSDNRWVANGMLLGWKWPGNSGSNIQLIDTTPSSPGAKNDAAIVIGQTFSDFEAGIHLTTLAVNNEDGVRSMDIMVQLGDFPSNLPPELTLSASGLNVPANAPVTFTATASDPNGDPLAYQWLSSDNSSASSAVLGSNAPMFVRSFSSAGQYVVTCVASDMKGGKAIRSALVTVGNGNSRFSISGRVTLGTNGLPGVYVATGGNNGVLTDSDGYYSIPNLAAGTYSVSPLLYGYAFSELFNNSVLIGPNFSGADFSADLLPTLSIAASIPTASEAPASGRFTITRTGPDTDPLTVKVLPLAGTAASTDYTLSPTPTTGSPYNTVTIPAGSDFVHVVVNPSNDTTAEGPETLVLELGLDAAYVISGSAKATVVINDNDTILPKVAITAPSVPAGENPSQPASFILTRTGPTTTNLPVKMAYTGTASNGLDYLLLSTTVTIPAGAAQAAITVNPIDDNNSEGYETVIAAILNDAIYLKDPLATNATLTIVDDDVQTVSLAVVDATAAEVDLNAPGAMPNPGTFLLTRTGDISQALTIFYSLSGSALHGVDYEPLPGSVTIPAGQASAAVTIMPHYDGLGEGTETVLLQLAAGGNNYRLGPTNAGTLTITDAGDPPYVEVIPYTSAREPSTSGRFRFTLKGSYAGSVAVGYTVSGTAVSGVDFSPLTGTVNINGSGTNNTSDVSVVPINDALGEDLETVTVTINPSPNYQAWGPTSSATIWLYDDDQPTVFVDAHTTSSSGLATVAENSGTAKFYVSRTGSTNASLPITYTLSGSASNGIDFGLLSGTTNIPAGFPGVDIIITPINDALAEGVETVTLNLGPGAYGRGPGATIYINDDEASTTKVSFAAGSSVSLESAGMVNVPVLLSAAAASPVSVDYEILTTGSASPSPVTASSSQPYWFRLTRSNDVFRGFHSGNGSTWTQVGAAQTMALANPVWVGFAVSSISDGSLSTAAFDNATLSPDPGGSFEGRDVGFLLASGNYSTNGGTHSVAGSGTGINGTQDEFYYAAKPISGDFSFTARLASHVGTSSSRFAGLMIREDMRRFARHATLGQQGTAQTQFYLRTNSTITAEGAGVDYTITPGRLTFPPGGTSNNITLTITDDSLTEPSEQLVLTLRNPTGAGLGTYAQHVLAIQDNDNAPLQPWVGFAGAATTVNEDGTPAILVSLGSSANTAVSVDYTVTGGTASAPDDFSLPGGTLTFAPGEMLKTIPITVLDDTDVEPSESVFLLLSNPVNATLTTSTNHTLFILDNELPKVSVVATDNSAHENGDTGQWTFTRTGDLSSPLTVYFIAGGTATTALDYTPLGTSMTIPSGTNAATLTIVPLADALVEGNETVVLSLQSNTNYVGAGSIAGTVTITDANLPIVNIVASDPTASETGTDPGRFTISRAGPTTAALTVNFTVTGTATSGTDFGSIGSAATLAAGQSNVLVTVNPVNDAFTEGSEYVVVSLSSSASYTLGSNSFASVEIRDNDNPPVVFISQPAAKAVQMTAGNGLYLQAEAMDDGAPNPLTYTWSKFSGPGSVTFGDSASGSTTASFSSNGLYILRISVSDGQFTVSDDVTVQVGPFTPAEWIDVSLGVPSTRGKSGFKDGVWTVTGSGAGVSGTSDSAHFVCRPVGTNATLVARLTTLASTNTAAVAGLMVRETGYRGARRMLLGGKPAGTLDFRTRLSSGGSDTSTSGGAFTYPVWLKLERSNNVVKVYRAADSSGAPGTWSQVGSSVTFTNLRDEVEIGFFASNGSQNTLANATFDNVSLTPAPVGPALFSEDLGSTTLLGGSTLSNTTHTIRGGNSLGDGGHFRFQQYVGDVTITARILNHTASGMSAKGGVMVRDASLDNGPYGMMGIAHYWGGYFTWRNVIGGSTATSYGGSASNPQWIRIIRKGNSVTAWKASNTSSNTPGTWTQQGSSKVFSADAPVYAGLAVDSSSSSTLNTVQLDNFSITPGNLAPVVNPGTNAIVIGSFPVSAFINASVAEDDRPNPPGESVYTWSMVTGPAPVTFTNTATVDTKAFFTAPGTYVLRLAANDGEASVFADVTYQVYSSPFEAWQFQNFAAGSSDPDSLPDADPDLDGWKNVAEYALGTNPKIANPSPITYSLVSLASERYFRIVIPKNPAATDVQYGLEYHNDPAALTGWSSLGLLTEQNTSTNLVLRDGAPISLNAWRFYRVRLTR